MACRTNLHTHTNSLCCTNTSIAMLLCVPRTLTGVEPHSPQKMRSSLVYCGAVVVSHSGRDRQDGSLMLWWAKCTSIGSLFRGADLKRLR